MQAKAAQARRLCYENAVLKQLLSARREKSTAIDYLQRALSRERLIDYLVGNRRSDDRRDRDRNRFADRLAEFTQLLSLPQHVFGRHYLGGLQDGVEETHIADGPGDKVLGNEIQSGQLVPRRPHPLFDH